jgi:hypothetical protein
MWGSSDVGLGLGHLGVGTEEGAGSAALGGRPA